MEGISRCMLDKHVGDKIEGTCRDVDTSRGYCRAIGGKRDESEPSAHSQVHRRDTAISSVHRGEDEQVGRQSELSLTIYWVRKTDPACAIAADFPRFE